MKRPIVRRKDIIRPEGVPSHKEDKVAYQKWYQREYYRKVKSKDPDKKEKDRTATMKWRKKNLEYYRKTQRVYQRAWYYRNKKKKELDKGTE